MIFRFPCKFNQHTNELISAQKMSHKHTRDISLVNSIKAKTSFSFVDIVQKLCESRGGRPGLSVLTSLLVSVDVKIY